MSAQTSSPCHHTKFRGIGRTQKRAARPCHKNSPPSRFSRPAVIRIKVDLPAVFSQQQMHLARAHGQIPAPQRGDAGGKFRHQKAARSQN